MDPWLMSTVCGWEQPGEGGMPGCGQQPVWSSAPKDSSETAGDKSLMASVIQLKQQQKIYLLISLYDAYQELLNKHRRRMIYRLFGSFFASIRWVTNPVPESPVEKMICHLLIIHLWGLFILGWESWGFKQLRCYGQRNTLIFILLGNRMESLILSIFVQI